MRYSASWELCFGTLAILSIFPIWIVEYPPIQDLPQHLAAIRVLHSYYDSTYGFESFFKVDLLRTQYLTYYLAAHLLSYLFDVVLANKILLSTVILLTPYAMRHLLSGFGHDQRLALLVFPLTYNAHLILGFFNFLAAIPLALIGISVAVRHRKHPTLGKEIFWALLALVTFYTHVVPFAFLILGALLISIGTDIKTTVRRLFMFIPAGLGVIFWIYSSPAGQSFMTAAFLTNSKPGPKPLFQPWNAALQDIPKWFTDVLRDDVDNQLMMAWTALLVAVILFGIGKKPAAQTAEVKLDNRLRLRLLLLPPIAALAYFITPTSYDWIWPIAQRFPILFAFLVIPILPSPRAFFGDAIFLSLAIVAAVQFYQVGKAFDQFEQKEMGNLKMALRTIPAKERVAGLIFSRGSRYVKFSPFIHSVAYYLVDKGGAVMFTFADFPASPFSFQERNRPPRVRPRWEWTPERVNPAVDLKWYKYVLTRGGPGIIARQRDVYHRIYTSRHWSVWRRK